MFEKIVLCDVATNECDIYYNAYRFEDTLAIWDDGGLVSISRIKKEPNSRLNLYYIESSEVLCDSVNYDSQILKKIINIIKVKTIYELIIKTRLDKKGLEEFNFNVDQFL